MALLELEWNCPGDLVTTNIGTGKPSFFFTIFLETIDFSHYICINICIHVYIYIYIYIHTYIHTYRQTDRQTDRHTDIHTYIHTYMYIIYIYIYIYTYTYIYTCIYICIHIFAGGYQHPLLGYQYQDSQGDFHSGFKCD